MQISAMFKENCNHKQTDARVGLRSNVAGFWDVCRCLLWGVFFAAQRQSITFKAICIKRNRLQKQLKIGAFAQKFARKLLRFCVKKINSGSLKKKIVYNIIIEKILLMCLVSK